VAVARAAALGRATGELDIHRALVEANLPLNIFLPPRHQIIAGHIPIQPVAAAPSRFEIGAWHRGAVWPTTHDSRTDRWTAARAARLAAADLRRADRESARPCPTSRVRSPRTRRAAA